MNARTLSIPAPDLEPSSKNASGKIIIRTAVVDPVNKLLVV